MENPLIAGFVEIQHEEELGRGAADCHKTVKIMSDEDFL